MAKVKWFMEMGLETIEGEFEVDEDAKEWEIDLMVFDDATSLGQLDYGWEIEDDDGE